MKKLIVFVFFITLLNSCNTNPVNSNFDVQKKFINDFQENWNNMDVEAMGNLPTVDTVFIDYPTNDIFKVNFKDAGFNVVRFPGGNASNDYFWDAENIGQCPEGTPNTIYKSDFKKTTSPKLGNQGSYRTRP